MNYLLLYIKGLCMGFSDVIPGVSGGTIAFIFGIYERFMNALKNINLFFILFFLSFLKTRDKKDLIKSQKEFMRMDPLFMLTIGLGIISAGIAGSFMIPYLLDNKPVYTYSFFIGLIVASIYFVYNKNIKVLRSVPVIYGIFGFIFGLIITGLSQLTSNHSLPVLFISGTLAISAMLLPGISGSFILLILGQYKYILEMIQNIPSHLIELAVFFSGIGVGVLAFSRVIIFFLKKFHDSTILFLIGLMAGSLRIIILNILNVNLNYPNLGFKWGILSVSFTLVFIIAGFLFVYLISSIEKNL